MILTVVSNYINNKQFYDSVWALQLKILVSRRAQNLFHVSGKYLKVVSSSSNYSAGPGTTESWITCIPSRSNSEKA